MSQLSLFVDTPPPRIWTRVSSGSDPKFDTERHMSGWEVRHCGHPTANYPFLIVSPCGRSIVSFNGMGFTSRIRARYIAEQLYLGRIAVRWVPDAYVVHLTAAGDKVPEGAGLPPHCPCCQQEIVNGECGGEGEGICEEARYAQDVLYHGTSEWNAELGPEPGRDVIEAIRLVGDY